MPTCSTSTMIRAGGENPCTVIIHAFFRITPRIIRLARPPVSLEAPIGLIAHNSTAGKGLNLPEMRARPGSCMQAFRYQS